MISPDAARHEKWMDLGSCTQIDPDLFFPDKGGSAIPAKKVCRECPVRMQCLRYAMGNDPGHGIFGGLTPRERAALRTALKGWAA